MTLAQVLGHAGNLSSRRKGRMGQVYPVLHNIDYAGGMIEYRVVPSRGTAAPSPFSASGSYYVVVIEFPVGHLTNLLTTLGFTGTPEEEEEEEEEQTSPWERWTEEEEEEEEEQTSPWERWTGTKSNAPTTQTIAQPQQRTVEEFSDSAFLSAARQHLATSNVKVDCTCPDWFYRFAYIASRYQVSVFKFPTVRDRYGRFRTPWPIITNPNGELGFCKHIYAVASRVVGTT